MTNTVNIGQDAPYLYNYQNMLVSAQNPSTMHSSDVGLTRFFQRYLVQRAISTFKWNMPSTWEENYFLYCLYCWGVVAIMRTDKFGIIPQGCSLKGYNVMYAPTHAVISNPLFKGVKELVIGKDCALLRLQPDYGGIYDLVSFYAEMMSMTAATAGSNIMASKLAYVLAAENKAFGESFKAMFDKIASGEPAVVVDKNMFTEDGKPLYSIFANNLNGNYIADQLLEDLEEWERRFDTEIGIPRTNTEKKERLVTGEVNSNLTQSYSRVDMWLQTLKKGCKKANELFGEELLSVDWRIDPNALIGRDIEGKGGAEDGVEK